MKPKSKPKAKSKPKPPIATESESPSEFAFAVARTAVSQICQSVGFKSAELSALQTLTAVAAAYLQAAAKSSAALAAAANRTDCNIFDVAAALRDLRSGPAISGATGPLPSAAGECALRSNALADIAAFAQSTPETPFAKPVPQPHRRSVPAVVAGGDNARTPRPPHVPHWLPEAPETASSDIRLRRGGGGEELWEDRVSEMSATEERESGERKWGLGEERERVSFKFKAGVGLRREKGLIKKKIIF